MDTGTMGAEELQQPIKQGIKENINLWLKGGYRLSADRDSVRIWSQVSTGYIRLDLVMKSEVALLSVKCMNCPADWSLC